MREPKLFVHPSPIRRLGSGCPSLSPPGQDPSVWLTASVDPAVGGSVSDRRFVIVSMPVGSRAAWPGEWLADAKDPVANRAWSAWRLLGANNRELARSIATYADTESCIVALRTVRDAAERLTAVFRPVPTTGRWYWQASANGVPLVVSARPFSWRRDCEHNFGQFVAALSVGEVEVSRLPVSYSVDSVATTG